MKIKHSYQSLHHVHSTLSHCTHLSKNIDRIDGTFLEFIKDRIYSKEDASSANTSTRKSKNRFTVERWIRNVLFFGATFFQPVDLLESFNR